MARGIVYFLLLQSFVCKVLSIYAQPSIQQYLHLTGVPRSVETIAVPATQYSAPPPQHTAPPPNIPATSQPRPVSGLPTFSALSLPNLVSSLQQYATQQSVPTSNYAANQPRPSTGLSSFSALALPNLVSSLQQLPAQKPSEVKTANPSSIDANLLNNLAIALQLLIISNILNSPPPMDSPTTKPVAKIPVCSEPYYSQTQAVMPNSNFIGTSSSAEHNLALSHKPTRNSMSLMSPYEALSPGSPYSDPILSQYGSTNPRQDFQSPYSMMADKDLFSMNDLF